MPTFDVVTGPLADVEADIVVVAALSSGGDGDEVARLAGDASALAERLDADLPGTLEAFGFTGEAGSVARVPTRGGLPARTLLVVGLGTDPDADAVRRAGAAVAEATSRLGTAATSLPWNVPGVDAEAAGAAFVEGVVLGAYRFDEFRSEADPHRLDRVVLAAPDDVGAVGAAIDAAALIADAVVTTRDLVNRPPAHKRPPALAALVAEQLDGTGVDVEVIDQDALEAGGYGGLVGVAAGSGVGARLVVLRWDPGAADRHVALVGKGITFDSGGLSLKPSQAMETMKYDMAGAAAVVGVVEAVAALELPVRVTGLLALAENMPGGSATRPSDVLRTRNGTTVEVVNTDAEGRLVLADALAHACELEPDVVVDIATLTGAAKMALGNRVAVVMSSDDELAAAIEAAGERAAERFWRLPFVEEYDEVLASEVADVRNAGWKTAGTIRAGLFLRRFVTDEVRWAHLDIAGVGWVTARDAYRAKGASGVPVRALVEWLRSSTATS